MNQEYTLMYIGDSERVVCACVFVLDHVSYELRLKDWCRIGVTIFRCGVYRFILIVWSFWILPCFASCFCFPAFLVAIWFLSLPSRRPPHSWLFSPVLPCPLVQIDLVSFSLCRTTFVSPRRFVLVDFHSAVLGFLFFFSFEDNRSLVLFRIQNKQFFCSASRCCLRCCSCLLIANTPQQQLQKCPTKVSGNPALKSGAKTHTGKLDAKTGITRGITGDRRLQK